MEQKTHHGLALQCEVHPLNSLMPYEYVVVCSWYQDKWLLSRHQSRSTWETQGGHIESGESPLEAARRELFEESGVTEAEIYPVCDFLGYTDNASASGMVFLAVIHQLGTLPKSEMAETALFDALPDNLTYPHVSPMLCSQAQLVLNEINKRK